MGFIKNFIKGQFIEVIEWTDMGFNEIVYRFPVQNKEIKMGAQLTVRESQMAVFINEGRIADIFSPGRYTLTTQNMPVMTKLESWKYGFDSPFKAEVYFISTKQFTNLKWGTSRPVMMRDQDFGLLRLRAYGIFSYKVNDAGIFLKELFGTSRSFTTEHIQGQLKRVAVSSLSDLLAESQIPALDFSMHYDELSAQGKQKLQAKFNSYGFELCSFIIENISLPEDVEKAMDKRTSMGVMGDLKKYAQYQAAEAITDAAQNEGGSMASAGVSLGAGAALGKMMTEAFSENDSKEQEVKILCPNCKTYVKKGAKFCYECGNKMTFEKKNCIKCNTLIKKTAKFCPECGAKQDEKIKCSECGAEVKPGGKFCSECGNDI